MYISVYVQAMQLPKLQAGPVHPPKSRDVQPSPRCMAAAFVNAQLSKCACGFGQVQAILHAAANSNLEPPLSLWLPVALA